MGTILEKPIEGVKESQSRNLDRIDSSQAFTDQLNIQNIHDLGDKRLIIKQDGQKYIFTIDGEDAFYVNGKKIFERLIGDFYEQQHTEETKIVVETTNLKLKILAGNTASMGRAAEIQNNSFDKALDIDDFKRRLDTYKEFFEAQIDDVKWQAFWLNPKYAGKEKAGYKMTKQAAEQQLKKLKNIEKRVNSILKEDRFQHIENLDYESRTTLLQFSEELDAIVSSIPDFVSFRNDIILGKVDTVPYFGTQINSIADAQKFATILRNFNEQQLKLNKYTADAATQQQYAQILQALQSYFENSINNPNNFQPYQFSAEQLLAINYFPKLKEAMGNIMPEQQKNNTNTPGSNRKESEFNQGIQNSSNEKKREKAPEYKDWNEALAKGGANGAADFFLDSKTKMSESQKESWKSIGNLAVTGGLIFVGWKFLKNAFRLFSSTEREKMKTDGGYAWLLAPLGLTFAANAFTGESPLAVLTGGKASARIASILPGGSKENTTTGTSNNNPSANTETTPSSQEKMKDNIIDMTAAMALFNGKNGAEIAQAVELDKTTGKMKIKPDVYDTIIQDAKNNPGDDNKKAAAVTLEKIGKDDSRNIIDMGLTLCGFSYESLTSSTTNKDIFNEKAANASARIAQVTTFMETNKVDRINTNQYHLIRNFIANPSGSAQDLTNLLARGDVFENSKELPPEDVRKNFKEQINKIDISDNEKGKLLASVNTFWHLWPTDGTTKGQMQILQEGKNILLKTYNKEVKINPIDNTIPGLLDKNGKEIGFTSTVELLKAANLVNRAFDLVKEHKRPLTKNPFNISLLGRDIEYANTDFWSKPSIDRFKYSDVTLVSGGYGGALKQISPILEENKDEFVNYLNKEYNTINNLN